MTTIEFIEKASKIHNGKYDYSKVNIEASTDGRVCIICPVHGEFWQRYYDHAKGRGCRVCGGAAKSNTETFIGKAQERYGDKYDYSKVQYVNNKTKVCIICHKTDIMGREHGEFWQRPNDHLSGYECPKCKKEYKPTTEEWVELANFIHHNEYDYSKVEYKNASTKVCIICPKHGEFWMTPLNHVHNKCKCPSCNSIKKSRLAATISSLLQENNIPFEQEKTFEWLKHKNYLYLDFYLTEHNIAIECQGEQHYRPIELFGGQEEYELTVARDNAKKQLCETNGIKIIYVNRRNIKDFKIEDILNETTSSKGEESNPNT